MASNESTTSIQGTSLERFYNPPDLWNDRDDWTGVTSTAQRKRLQNRLNQRAWRRRQKLNTARSRDALPACQVPSAPPGPSENTFTGSVEGLLLLVQADEACRLRVLLQQAYEEYTLNAPRLTALPLVTRINVLNALARNAAYLNIPSVGLCCVHLISPFNLSGPSLPNHSSSEFPRALQPTELQKKIIHHPWIDLLPFPALRDNMLRFMALGLLNDDRFCDDILGMRVDELSSSPAMIVWGEPSDWNAWEVNAAFLRNWGFLVKGCAEIFEATNNWRCSRGEKQLDYTD
ncbi:hypothetical protein FALCPG4_002080 [Fusarium falciforme]